MYIHVCAVKFHNFMAADSKLIRVKVECMTLTCLLLTISSEVYYYKKCVVFDFRVSNSANKAKNQNNKKIEEKKEPSVSPELDELQSTFRKKVKRKQKTKESAITDPKLVNKKYGLIPQHSPLHPSPSRTSPNESKNMNSNSDYKLPR